MSKLSFRPLLSPLLMSIIILTSVSACGLKGPLYLPEEDAEADESPGDEAGAARRVWTTSIT